MSPRAKAPTAYPTAYAATTKVPVAKTRLEIDTLLERIGAAQRGTYVDDDKNLAVVGFVLGGAKYRIDVPLPARPRFSPDLSLAKHEQATRSRWRGVLLLLKAKIEAVRLGLTSFEKEFLADRVLGDGRTVQQSIPDIIRTGLAGGPPQLEEHHG